MDKQQHFYRPKNDNQTINLYIILIDNFHFESIFGNTLEKNYIMFVMIHTHTHTLIINYHYHYYYDLRAKPIEFLFEKKFDWPIINNCSNNNNFYYDDHWCRCAIHNFNNYLFFRIILKISNLYVVVSTQC